MTTKFVKYPHLERLGHPLVEDILNGDIYVFPKLDGTNASMWYDPVAGKCCYGSRNRQLSIEQDNQGFMAAMEGPEGEQYRLFCAKFPHLRLYGEWLVPHSIKHYRPEAYNQFYIFDVWDSLLNRFIHYEQYYWILSNFEVNVVAPLAFGNIASFGEEVKKTFSKLAKNTYLIDTPGLHGEGIVIKRYDYSNRFGNTVWAKIINDSFVNVAGNKVPTGSLTVEEDIANALVTQALVDKEYAKIINDQAEYNSVIPRLLGTVYHCVISEELYGYLKRIKGPVNFKQLQKEVYSKVKELKKELFNGS